MFNETKQMKETTTVEVAAKLLPVLDNFERAFQAVTAENEKGEEVVSEYRGIYDSFLTVLDGLNVKEIACLGKEFDYNSMEVITQMPSEDFKEGEVCQVFQKGWAVGGGGKVVRPSIVAVAA